MPSKFADIIDVILQDGTPSRLHGSFSRLPCDPRLVDLPEDRGKLLERLRKRIGVEELVRHRVVQRGSDKTIALSDSLSANGNYLCALKRSDAERPFDLLLGGGNALGKMAADGRA